METTIEPTSMNFSASALAGLEAAVAAGRRPAHLAARIKNILNTKTYAAGGAGASDPFQDSDGLISFVNLSTDMVTNNPEFKTGRTVCDKICNFFASFRVNTFQYLTDNPTEVLPGDAVPETQWDSSVTHYMQSLLNDAGGLSGFKIVQETYSITQVIADFNIDIIKAMFDAATCPPSILNAVASFVSSVGDSLRLSWDDRSRNYQLALMGQCHEAVPIDATGVTTVYFPKVKYYHILVNSSQQCFTSPCTSVQKITFDFQYEYYVAGLKNSLLDPDTQDYDDFVTNFLDVAQGISYKKAKNKLDAILDKTKSTQTTSFALQLDANNQIISELDANLLAYPRSMIQIP